MTKQEILDSVIEEEVMDFFFDNTLKFDEEGFLCEYERYVNPFRNDNRPGCTFSYGEDGRLRFIDWADKRMGGDIFDIAMLYYKCPFWDAAMQIYEKFSKNKNQKIERKEKVQKRISSSTEILYEEYFGNDRAAYFNKGGITEETLKYFNVIPAKRTYLSNGEIFNWTPFNPVYIYDFTEIEKKVYLPFRNKTNKWRSSSSINIIEGDEQLPKKGILLIITKSLKDVMTLYEIGIPAISTISEAVPLRRRVYEKYAEQFKYIISLFDNDAQGFIAAKELKKRLDISYIYFNEEEGKDAFEVSCKYGLKYLSETICKKIKQLNL